VGESQDCNWVARGWVSSLFFVVFSNVSRAALKTEKKLEEEGQEAMGAALDIGLVGNDQSDGKTRTGPGCTTSKATASSAAHLLLMSVANQITA